MSKYKNYKNQTYNKYNTNIIDFINDNWLHKKSLKERYEKFFEDILEDIDMSYEKSNMDINDFLHKYKKGLDLKNAEHLYEGAIDSKIKNRAKELIDLIKRKNKEEEG